MARTEDVAALLMQHLETTTTMKLQKLLYYCQGWHLAWDGVPLFKDRIEAWANGPVVPAIYKRHRKRFTLSHPWPKSGDRDRLNRDETETVEAVLEGYGDWSAFQLTRSTHREPPWINARRGIPAGMPGTNVISLRDMQDYFAGLSGGLDVEEE